MWTTNACHVRSAQDERTAPSTEVEVQGQGMGDLLIFVVHVVVEFRMTDLTEHFSVNLSCVTIRRVFIVFLDMFLPFCLD